MMITMGSQDAAAPAGPAVIDAARRLLSDFTRCPSCAARLPGNHCPACGVDLSGPEGQRVGDLSVRAGHLLAERDAVLKVLRAQVQGAGSPVPPAPVASSILPTSPAGTSPPVATPAPAGTSSPISVPPPPSPNPPSPNPPRPTPPRQDPRSGLGVHGLLVSLGALLLAVA